MRIHVDSEIGRLKGVLVHRPGRSQEIGKVLDHARRVLRASHN